MVIGADGFSEQRRDEQPMGEQLSDDEMFLGDLRRVRGFIDVPGRQLSELDDGELAMLRHHLDMMMFAVDGEQQRRVDD